MTLSVSVLRPDGSLRTCPGPFDLATATRGDTVVVTGTAPARDYARWSGAIGSAVIRGAEVKRR